MDFPTANGVTVEWVAHLRVAGSLHLAATFMEIYTDVLPKQSSI